MTDPDLSRLGAWADLPFFSEDWPDIRARLDAEDAPIYPPRALTFAALERTQPGDTKVLILGQDPYHTPSKADGLAFSIAPGFSGNLASLGNIFKELQDDLNLIRPDTQLHDWADQGVLLLNTALSVPEGRPAAHAKIGWKTLIHQVLGRLDDTPRALILWGRHAHGFGARMTHPDHLRIETAHPSPLSARRGFFGSRPFSRVNDWLQARGDAVINWGNGNAATTQPDLFDD